MGTLGRVFGCCAELTTTTTTTTTAAMILFLMVRFHATLFWSFVIFDDVFLFEFAIYFTFLIVKLFYILLIRKL